jgi:hypothetical protein
MTRLHLHHDEVRRVRQRAPRRPGRPPRRQLRPQRVPAVPAVTTVPAMAAADGEVLEGAVEAEAAGGVEELAARAGDEAAEQAAREALLAEDLGGAGEGGGAREVAGAVGLHADLDGAEGLREDVGEDAADAGEEHAHAVSAVACLDRGDGCVVWALGVGAFLLSADAAPCSEVSVLSRVLRFSAVFRVCVPSRINEKTSRVCSEEGECKLCPPLHFATTIKKGWWEKIVPRELLGYCTSVSAFCTTITRNGDTQGADISYHSSCRC